MVVRTRGQDLFGFLRLFLGVAFGLTFRSRLWRCFSWLCGSPPVVSLWWRSLRLFRYYWYASAPGPFSGCAGNSTTDCAINQRESLGISFRLCVASEECWTQPAMHWLAPPSRDRGPAVQVPRGAVPARLRGGLRAAVPRQLPGPAQVPRRTARRGGPCALQGVGVRTLCYQVRDSLAWF